MPDGPLSSTAAISRWWGASTQGLVTRRDAACSMGGSPNILRDCTSTSVDMIRGYVKPAEVGSSDPCGLQRSYSSMCSSRSNKELCHVRAPIPPVEPGPQAHLYDCPPGRPHGPAP